MSRRPRSARREYRRFRPPEDESIAEFFFENGDPRRPRRELVRRDELWGALMWFERRIIRENRWWWRLWRTLRRFPVTRLSPRLWVAVETRRREREEQKRG
jgi:hypothetical protein